MNVEMFFLTALTVWQKMKNCVFFGRIYRV